MAPQLSPLPVLNHEELNGALLDVQAGRNIGRGTGGNGGNGSAGLSVPGSPINKYVGFLFFFDSPRPQFFFLLRRRRKLLLMLL